MRLEAEVTINFEGEKLLKEVESAALLGLRDVTVAVTAFAVEHSPWETGNNRRSLAAEVSTMGLVATGGEGGEEGLVDHDAIEAAVFSTSGYGGFLETGTTRMPARPYMKPGMDLYFTAENYTERVKAYLR